MDSATRAYEVLLDAYANKMRRENLSPEAIDTFSHYFRQLVRYDSATIPESSITPVTDVSIKDHLATDNHRGADTGALKKCAVIKLNGGLGTTMGLKGPKSLIKVKNGLSFLDITVKQISAINDRYGAQIPLFLMNSFFTDSAIGKALARYQDLPKGRVESFLQNKFPKVLADSLEPPLVPEDPSLEWNPPGHGDLLLSLSTSGTLTRLLEAGITTVFVSNIDNLGAELDAEILAFFQAEKLDFLMEVTDRTPMDRKGGHIALDKNGSFILRESAQCDNADRDQFADISRHRFFNTNNLWLNLESVQRIIDKRQHLKMPLIVNRKKLDQSDPASPAVFHLETALGSAINLFEKSGVIRVDRTRFAPVKSCDELLLVWSDGYQLHPDFRITANPARQGSAKTVVTLDPEFYSRIDLLESHFPFGAPSLIDCSSFSVKGDVRFGSGIALHGQVSIVNTTGRQVQVKDNASVSGELVF